MSIEAMKQALEALESGDGWRQSDAITDLRTAIEQAAVAEPHKKQEPLGYWLIGTDHVEFEKHEYHDGPEWEAVYTTPPAAQPAPVQESFDTHNLPGKSLDTHSRTPQKSLPDFSSIFTNHATGEAK